MTSQPKVKKVNIANHEAVQSHKDHFKKLKVVFLDYNWKQRFFVSVFILAKVVTLLALLNLVSQALLFILPNVDVILAALMDMDLEQFIYMVTYVIYSTAKFVIRNLAFIFLVFFFFTGLSGIVGHKAVVKLA